VPVDRACARAVIELVERLSSKCLGPLGQPVSPALRELYSDLRALPRPPRSAYEDLAPAVRNGIVGTIAPSSNAPRSGTRRLPSAWPLRGGFSWEMGGGGNVAGALSPWWSGSMPLDGLELDPAWL